MTAPSDDKWISLKVSELDISGFIYRLWDAQDECLYVGQTTQLHPLMRIDAHRDKSWWPEVVWCDYLPVPAALLFEVEAQQIRECNPRHNVVRYRLKNRRVPPTLQAELAAIAQTFDELGIDPSWGRDRVRKVLRDHKVKAIRNDTLGAVIRYRRERF